MRDTVVQNMQPGYPCEHLSAMLPEVYQKVNPVVMMTCEMYDVPSNPQMYPYPSRVVVNQMADNIYNIVSSQFVFSNVSEQQIGLSSRILLRDIILILLIAALLRRRGTIF